MRYRKCEATSRSVLGLAFVIAVGACFEDRVDPTAAAPAAQLAKLRDARPTSIRPEESEFAELARSAPSSAGYYQDDNGDLVISVRDTGEVAAIMAAATGLVATRALRSSRSKSPHVRVSMVKYSFFQLAAWRDALEGELGAIEGITSLDLNERANSVTVGIDPKHAVAAREKVKALSARLGVDQGAVDFSVHPPLSFSVGSVGSAGATLIGSNIFSQVDTVVGGIIVRSSSSVFLNGGPGDCTLGFIVDRNGTRAMVTATHCTAVWGGGPDGTTMSQWLGRTLGPETLDPNKSPCSWLNWCRNSDAALFNISAAVPSHRGLIARTTYRNAGYHNGGNGSRIIDETRPYFVVTQAGAALPAGYEVQKMGQVTGWTWGIIGSTCVDHFFSAPGPVYYKTLCGYAANILHNSGDSGGPFFTWDGGDEVTLLGTLVGQTSTTNGVYSPYSRITADFGGTMVATRGVNLSAPTGITGTINGTHPQVSWNSVSGASRYNAWVQYYQYAGEDEYGNPQYDPQFAYWGTFTGTSFVDPTRVVTPVGGCAWWMEVGYWVKAASNTEVSPATTTVNFCQQ